MPPDDMSPCPDGVGLVGSDPLGAGAGHRKLEPMQDLANPLAMRVGKMGETEAEDRPQLANHRVGHGDLVVTLPPGVPLDQRSAGDECDRRGAMLVADAAQHAGVVLTDVEPLPMEARQRVGLIGVDDASQSRAEVSGGAPGINGRHLECGLACPQDDVAAIAGHADHLVFR
jgi:hypothetical protein